MIAEIAVKAVVESVAGSTLAAIISRVVAKRKHAKRCSYILNLATSAKSEKQLDFFLKWGKDEGCWSDVSSLKAALLASKRREEELMKLLNFKPVPAVKAVEEKELEYLLNQNP